MYVVAIVSFIGLMAWLFSQQIDEQRNPNQAPTGSTTPTGATQVRLQRNRQGHYIANGEINGARAEFIVDTGATDVAVSAEVARRAGLVAGPAVAVTTANGRATAYVTRIDELKLGTIVEHNVRAGETGAPLSVLYRGNAQSTSIVPASWEDFRWQDYPGARRAAWSSGPTRILSSSSSSSPRASSVS